MCYIFVLIILTAAGLIGTFGASRAALEVVAVIHVLISACWAKSTLSYHQFVALQYTQTLFLFFIISFVS